MHDNLIPLLPLCATPKALLFSEKIPCHTEKIEIMVIKYILEKLKRETWVEGLYAKKEDLAKIKRYKNSNGQYKNDFDEKQFLTWVKMIEDNTAICSINKIVGKGIFVPPDKKLPKGIFIPSSGIIKLNPTKEELETKNHCSALQDLNSLERKIYGFIDPEKQGGIFDLINHAPDDEEVLNFKFRHLSIKENVSTSNLKSTIKFYNGYAIMGVEVFQDINGGQYGKQLLWSYAQPDEYLSYHPSNLDNPRLVLFDNRNEHNGEIIDVINYSLRKIDIFINTGEIMLRKVTSLTRWELMQNAPKSGLNLSIEDPYSSAQTEIIKSSISYGFLQTYLKQNPVADRVIIKIPSSDLSLST